MLTACTVAAFSNLPDPKGYYPFHPNVNTSFSSSSLPIVIIELNEKMADKEADTRVSGTMKIIWDKTGGENNVSDTDNYDYNGYIGIKYRGNTSYMFSEKKPFALRLQDAAGSKIKEKILGMAKDDDWALLGPYNDKSMIRDMMVYTLMQGTLDYVPAGRYCELIIDGIYQGVYIMAARVRQGDNRLNLKKPSDTTEAGIRGYHLEIDGKEAPYIESCVPLKDLYDNDITNREWYQQSTVYYQLKYPDLEDLSDVQWKAVKEHVWGMEKAIAGDDWNDPVKGYRAYFDTISAMNYIIAQELVRNVDGYRRSTSIYRDLTKADKRFKFSIWDFNPSMGNGDYISGWGTEGWSFNNNQYGDGTNPQFFKRMLQDEVFYANLKARWTEYRKDRFSEERITEVMDSLVNLIKIPAARNYATWGYPVTPWPNYYYAQSWETELEYLRTWMNQRLKWLDSQWSAEVVNKVVNGTFDAAYARTPEGTNALLSDWKTEGEVGLTANAANVYAGKYALSMYPDRKAWQTLTELTPGKYTFRCMIKTQGDPKATLAFYYCLNKSSLSRSSIKNSTTYYKLEIKDIEVNNHFAEIQFATGNVTGNVRLWVDDVEFFKQPEQGSSVIKVPYTSFNLKADYLYGNLELECPDVDQYTRIDVFDVSGNNIYSGYADAPVVKIEGRFVRNHLYFVRVGNHVQKVLF